MSSNTGVAWRLQESRETRERHAQRGVTAWQGHSRLRVAGSKPAITQSPSRDSNVTR